MVSDADFVLGAEEAFHEHWLEKHRTEWDGNPVTDLHGEVEIAQRLLEESHR